MKDDFSHFCELINDTATHFKNQLLEELCHKTQMTQSFTLAYCPWINGSIERLNRDVLQVLRVMLLEYKVKQSDWSALLPLIQSNLNYSPVASLANHAPAEVFMGAKATTPLHKVLIGEDAIAENVEKQTKRNQSNQRGAWPVNFHIGDYVLWSRVDAKTHVNKLAVKWIGPFRVISAKVNSFEIEYLVTGTSKTVLASRLKLYADSSFEIDEEILEHIGNQDIYLTVEEFKGHREHPEHGYEVLVGWEGLETLEDSWEPVKILQEDVPVKLNAYLSKVDDAKLHSFVSKLTLPCAGGSEKEPIVQHPGTASQQRKGKTKGKRRNQKKNLGN
ncbi:Hypothetical protein PHPALM_37857 [Phytophthora palmivora]|uniref:Integrase catalytic domain-containing protein n=1 Tax=Phytophthora palmivora TaxID=4796 RepID=A0A2P4WWC8_9STRA|nr:Hypothetical protein PHPALM_37857 [Phytophthora palmivora]